jgi:UDP-N-acetyl-D-mannosaminuronate dehydrogenase
VKDLVEALKGSDVVIVATDHNHYKEVTPCKLVELSQNPGLIIIDARDVIDVSECCGARYLGIGRGRKCA